MIRPVSPIRIHRPAMSSNKSLRAIQEAARDLIFLRTTVREGSDWDAYRGKAIRSLQEKLAQIPHGLLSPPVSAQVRDFPTSAAEQKELLEKLDSEILQTEEWHRPMGQNQRLYRRLMNVQPLVRYTMLDRNGQEERIEREDNPYVTMAGHRMGERRAITFALHPYTMPKIVIVAGMSGTGRTDHIFKRVKEGLETNETLAKQGFSLKHINVSEGGDFSQIAKETERMRAGETPAKAIIFDEITPHSVPQSEAEIDEFRSAVQSYILETGGSIAFVGDGSYHTPTQLRSLRKLAEGLVNPDQIEEICIGSRYLSPTQMVEVQTEHANISRTGGIHYTNINAHFIPHMLRPARFFKLPFTDHRLSLQFAAERAVTLLRDMDQMNRMLRGAYLVTEGGTIENPISDEAAAIFASSEIFVEDYLDKLNNNPRDRARKEKKWAGKSPSTKPPAKSRSKKK